MLSKADEFRAQAADCDEQATKVTSGIVRESYIENARWWRELAAQTERIAPDNRRDVKVGRTNST
jgi:hypothetical protein